MYKNNGNNVSRNDLIIIIKKYKHKRYENSYVLYMYVSFRNA